MHASDIMYSAYVVITVVGALIHMFISRHTLHAHRVAEILLLWILVVMVGVSGLISAIFHLFLPEFTAATIGWADSPFQREVGFADLGAGILGILCAWFRGLFWWATGTWTIIFLGGDGIGHIIEQQATGNFAQANSGMVLATDLLVPLTLIILLPIYQFTKDRVANPSVQPA